MGICPQGGSSEVTLVAKPVPVACRTGVIAGCVFEQCRDADIFSVHILLCLSRYCRNVSNGVIRQKTVHTEAENGVSLCSLL